MKGSLILTPQNIDPNECRKKFLKDMEERKSYLLKTINQTKFRLALYKGELEMVQDFLNNNYITKGGFIDKAE